MIQFTGLGMLSIMNDSLIVQVMFAVDYYAEI